MGLPGWAEAVEAPRNFYTEPRVDRLGLERALGRLLEETTAREAVASRLIWRLGAAIDEELARELYAALEDALAWMVRSGAARVMVRVAFEGSQLTIDCVDECAPRIGRVCDATALIARLRERVEGFDGRVEMTGQPPRGTRLRISVACRFLS